MNPVANPVHAAVSALLGEVRAEAVLTALEIDPALTGGNGESGTTRAQAAMALNIVLFARLLDQAPTAARYVGEVRESGRRVCFDHGALRTIDGATGSLPRGRAAFTRLLEPLGYRPNGVYPLPRLKMTGFVFTHADLAETVPQFFVSELHVAQLPKEARSAADRVFGASTDPLDRAAQTMLNAMTDHGRCAPELLAAALPALVRAFGRHHPAPALADYEALLAHSAEAAWIATEGNAFNHATDRVNDVVSLAATLRARGYPLKPVVEHSASGRVHQTAFLADKVVRDFIGPDGQAVARKVPGSFYEFITRDRDPATGKLDLGFDSGNAAGIFAMTEAR